MPYRTPAAVAKRKAEVRARLLAAARALFATRGYTATTIQQIVSAAGTSVGNCYFYFPDKAALLLALFEEQMQAIGQAVDAGIAATPAGVGQLAVAVYQGAVALLANPEIARIALLEINHPDVRQKAQAYFVGRVLEYFRRQPLAAQGADLALAAQAWQGANFQVLYTALLGELSATPEQIGVFLARWNLQALGLAPEQVQVALAELEAYRSARP